MSADLILLAARQDETLRSNLTEIARLDLALAQARAENDVLKQECRELTEQRDAARGELAELTGHHQRAVEQRNKDWDALMVEIALAVGSEEEREGAECGEIEEFDPWHALRKFRAADTLRLYDQLGESLEQAVGGDGTSPERLQQLVADRDAARTELRDVLVIKQQLTEERDTAVAQLAGYRVLFDEQGRALTATRASVASLRERLDQYMPIDSVLGDWQWSQIVEDGCIDDVALMRAAEALAHIEREQAKAKEAKAASNVG